MLSQRRVAVSDRRRAGPAGVGVDVVRVRRSNVVDSMDVRGMDGDSELDGLAVVDGDGLD